MSATTAFSVVRTRLVSPRGGGGGGEGSANFDRVGLAGGGGHDEGEEAGGGGAARETPAKMKKRSRR
jgi:hypothetical protein